MIYNFNYEKLIDNTISFLKSNYLYVICTVVYFVISVFLLGGHFSSFMICFVLYALSFIIALSPVSDWILKLIHNVRPVETKEEKNYMVPIWDEVLEVSEMQNSNLKLFIQDTMSINAFAFSNNSVTISKGAIETFSEDELKAVLLHEIAHIKHGDTRIKLLALVGNGFFSIFVLFARFILNLFDLANNPNANKNSISGFGAFFSSIIRLILEASIFVIMFIFNITTAFNSRSNEFYADYFAYEHGYGEELTEALYLLQKISLDKEMGLMERMTASHPRVSLRIKEIENLLDSE